MVSPKLIILYTSTWKPIMKNGGNPSGEDMMIFIESLPKLRESLTCALCKNILCGDEIFSATCDHFSCKGCLGKARKEDFLCGSCKDWDFFKPDETLKFLLEGYSEFCRFFLRTKNCTRLLEMRQDSDESFDGIEFIDFLQEGSRLHVKGFKIESPFNTTPHKEVSSAFNIGQKSLNSTNEIQKVVQVTVDKEQPIDIKIEPVFDHPEHEEEVRMDEVEIHNESSTSQDPLENNVEYDDMEDDEIVEEEPEEEEIEDENEEDEEEELEEIRTSSLITTSQPQPQTTQISQITIPTTSHLTFPTSITIQRSPQPIVSTTSQQQMHFSPRQIHSFVLTRPVPSNVVGQGQQLQLPAGRFPAGTSTIRLARLSLDGRPLTMVRHLLSSPTSTGLRHTVTLPLSAADLMNKKIIVRPTTYGSASPSTTQMQRWPDANKVLQYASGGAVISQGTIQQQQKSINICTTSSMPVTFTSSFVNTSVESRPQNITKISLGNMASSGGTVASSSSVLPSTSSTSSSNNIIRPTNPTSISSPAAGKIIGTVATAVRSDGQGGPVKKLKVRLPKTKLSPKIRRGCRCGNAATQPGKLTCCGQRCPCYVDAKSCTDCKCRGCRNPHLPGGKKLLQGINAVIDTKTNTTVPFAVSVASASTPSSIVTSVPMTPSSTMSLIPISHNSGNTSAPQIFTTRIHHPGTSQSTTTTFSQLIPLANFAGFHIPISLISPANSGHTIQTHSDSIRIQNLSTINANINNMKRE